MACKDTYANDNTLLNIMNQWMQMSESSLQVHVLQKWQKMVDNC
jgi:hypothetical protein